MSLDHLLAAIDAEISRLQEARALLAGTTHQRRSVKQTAPAPTSKKLGVRRTLSPEARKRIADAQRKRWAAQKKAAKIA